MQHNMSMTFMVLVTFTLGFVLDIIQVAYTNAAFKNRKYVAANWSVLFAGFAALLIICVVHNPWLMIPYLLGVWMGTVVSISEKDNLDE